MKRKISLMLAMFIVVLSCAVPQVFAAGTESGKIAEKLYRLGILSEDYTAKLDETANRCELARIAVELMGFDPEEISGGEGESPIFTDVHPMSMAGSYVYAAGKLGLMNGYGTEFGVDDPVRYEDAVRVLLRTVGYGDYAENVVGLYRAISETGIVRGVTVENGEAIDYRTLLKMADNALEIDLMYPIDNGEGTDYMKETGRTLLNTVHDITKISGEVTANEYTSVHSGGAAREGEVKIDNEIYAAGKSNAGDWLGSTVDAWISDIDSDTPEIKYIEDKKGSRVISFDADSYMRVSGRDIYYYADGGSAHEEISQTANVIYNNQFLCKFYDLDAALLADIDYGDISIKDADGDDVFETVVIADIKTDMITAFDSSAQQLICKNGTYDLSVSARDVVKVYKDGAAASVAALGVGGAAEIRESADGKLIFINIITKSVIGTPTELADDNTVVLNGQAYRYIAAYAEQDFVLGRMIKVYINGDKIVYVSDDAMGDEYLYGLVAGKGSNSGLNKNYQLKIFDQTGTMQVYTVADKFRLDGESTGDHKKIAAALGTSEQVQLIKYKLNGDNKITDIDTAARGTNEDDKNLTENCRNQSLTYKKTRTFGNGEYYLGTDTILFSAPDDAEEEERYFMQSASSFANDTNYTVSVYDMNEYHIPKAVVIHNGGGTIEGDNSVIVVEKITQQRAADGTVRQVIYGGNGGVSGQTKYWYTNGGACVPQVSSGDVIQVSAYATGELSGYKVLVNQKTTYGSTASTAKYNYAYGTIVRYDKANGICVINVANDETVQERISVIASQTAYKVTTEKGTTAVVTASASDLIPGKRIYVRERYLEPAEYVVFDE